MISRPARLGLALLVVASAALPGEARAHGRSTSTSSWTLEPGATPGGRVQVRVQLNDVHRTLPALAGLTPAELEARATYRSQLDRYLTDRIALEAGGERCPVSGAVVAVPGAEPTHLNRSWRVRCRGSGSPELVIRPFFEALPGHVHLARVRHADGRVLERVFVLDDTRMSVAADAGDPLSDAGSGFSDYVALGVEHIATGWDHLVFLLALLLAGASLMEVATIVTGFTVAHSVTLALGVLGVVEPLAAAVEALIGLSIVVVALENFAITAGRTTRRWIVAYLALGSTLAAAGALAGVVAVPATALLGVGVFALGYLGLLGISPRPGRLRWFIAFVFGLVHGFGFAGLLVEIGLPQGRLAAALLGFNVGVELGQLAIVAVSWPLLHLAMTRAGVSRPLLVQLGSTPVLVAGLYWFLTRALG